MKYLYIIEIRYLFVFSIFSSIIYLSITYLLLLTNFITNLAFLYPIFWIIEEFYLDFFVYPITLISFLYIYQRLYKIEVPLKTKFYLFYLFMFFSFSLKLFFYIKLHSQTILLHSLESFAIFSLVLDIILQGKEEKGRILPRILLLFSLLPIIRFFSTLSSQFHLLFNVFFFSFFLPAYTYVNYEMVYFYKSKRLMIPNIYFLFFSLLFLLLATFSMSKALLGISFLLFFLSIALILSNTRISEVLLSDKPYKRAIPVIYLFSLISTFSIFSLYPEDYLPTFAMTFVVVLQMFFYSLLFDIFPSINFSLYPTEGVRSSIFWYYLINGLFLSVSIFTGKLLYETLLAVYTLSLILNILVFKEVIFLSSTL